MYWEADKAQLDELCQEVHRLVTNREFEKAKALAEQAMAAYPNAPQPTIFWELCWRRCSATPWPCATFGQPTPWTPAMVRWGRAWIHLERSALRKRPTSGMRTVSMTARVGMGKTVMPTAPAI